MPGIVPGTGFVYPRYWFVPKHPREGYFYPMHCLIDRDWQPAILLTASRDSDKLPTFRFIQLLLYYYSVISYYYYSAILLLYIIYHYYIFIIIIIYYYYILYIIIYYYTILLLYYYYYYSATIIQLLVPFS